MITVISRWTEEEPGLMTVTCVMIIGGAVELFVSATAKVKNTATQINVDSRTGLEITGREYHDGESMLKVRKS
jgi:hypothetical protein